ncbi:hypothetical protein BcepSauron_410 [Burkholderia phage BcepSauron]|uniref:Uncharacterized protein n=1 Tax=Burkholderia phage BcepSauron TaxID=2530033 RepID=A0A482MNT9_9CAUD|nr:hypothetical protein H1O17_gp410 [Burkholderia phage BcepSauron]QBQ74790.1 hypothetical protein BcepSauron_410 [Burkholderia phage BcepSauron]
MSADDTILFLVAACCAVMILMLTFMKVRGVFHDAEDNATATGIVVGIGIPCVLYFFFHLVIK